MRHYPYAPYLMHVIEQVSGIRFSTYSNHKLLKITNKTSITAVRELKKKADKGKCKGASGSRSRHDASPLAASRASSAKPLPSSSSGKKPSKFKFLVTYMFG